MKGRHLGRADNRRAGDDVALGGLRLEIGVGATALVTLTLGIVGGISPEDWLFWYSIPAALIGLGLLLAKRTYVYSMRGRRLVSLLLASLTAVLVVAGAAIALEHYAATPIDMGGHPL